jgi:hypothetical protein
MGLPGLDVYDLIEVAQVDRRRLRVSLGASSVTRTRFRLLGHESLSLM